MKTTFDAAPLYRVAQRLERQMGGQQLASGLNHAATSARVVFTRHWADEVNLPLAYIESLYTVRPAAASRLVAEVLGRRRDVQLRQYGAQRVFGPNGKAAGVSVAVTPGGGRKTIGKAFFLPLKRGKVSGGNGEGVFVRIGGKLKLLYGPAPYQAFARLAPDAIEAGERALQETVGAAIERIVFEVSR